MRTAAATGPVVAEDAVTFRLLDPGKRLAGVRLLQELRRPRNEPAFERRGERWEARFPRLGAARLEYLLELVHPDGRSEAVCDPGNPRRAAGPFGDKSVIEFPGYEPPRWTRRSPRSPGSTEPLSLRSQVLQDDVEGQVWSSTGVSEAERAPLLLVHDGLEYAQYSELLRCLALAVDDGELPPMRAALLEPPGGRDETYSASAAYARALSHEVLPALSETAPTPPGRAARAAMGASLGALALLHAHRRHPAAFGALFLQSGSFFRARFDHYEARFSRFRRISRFVGTVLASDDWAHPPPVTITCGSLEENLANNRAVAAALRDQGYPLVLHEHADAHNWISWRDVLHPHLIALLQRAWS